MVNLLFDISYIYVRESKGNRGRDIDRYRHRERKECFFRRQREVQRQGMTCRDIKRRRDDREVQRQREKKRQWLRGRDRKENKR
jgi:hypothetical protein